MSHSFIDRGLGGDQAQASARWAHPRQIENPSVQWDDLIAFEDAAPALLLGEYPSGIAAQTCTVAGEGNEPGQDFAYRVAEHAALFWKDDRHVVTIAGSRADKGVASIIPNVALYGGSVVVNDPKGEVASLTALRRGAGSKSIRGLGQKVAVLDPYRVADVPDGYRSGFNPLDLLGPDKPNSVADAGTLAAAFAPGESGSTSQHFIERARGLIEGLMLHCVSKEPKERRNLVTVYEYLTVGVRPPPESAKVDPFVWLLKLMRDNTDFGGTVEAAARILGRLGPDEFGGIVSTAERLLSFLKYEGPRAMFARSMPFELEELKTSSEGCSIYVCLPVSHLATHAAMIRMLIQQTITLMERTPGQPKTGLPVLLVLDEFATLGHMRVIEDAAGYMAGFGVKLWAVLQDLGQLKSLYRDRWETFLNNAGVIMAWSNADLTTQEYLSKRLGQAELRRIVASSGSGDSFTGGSSANANQPDLAAGRQGTNPDRQKQRRSATQSMGSSNSLGESSNTGTSENIQHTPLLNPDEVGILFSRESGRMLVLINGERPLVLNRVLYFNRFEFMGKVGQDARFSRPMIDWQEAQDFRQQIIAKAKQDEATANAAAQAAANAKSNGFRQYWPVFILIIGWVGAVQWLQTDTVWFDQAWLYGGSLLVIATSLSFVVMRRRSLRTERQE